MIGLYVYVTFGLYYLVNVVIFFSIHLRKTKKESSFSSESNDGMISLFNNESISEPLLTNNLDNFDNFV